jgi:hypothetical protein
LSAEHAEEDVDVGMFIIFPRLVGVLKVVDTLAAASLGARKTHKGTTYADNRTSGAARASQQAEKSLKR